MTILLAILSTLVAAALAAWVTWDLLTPAASTEPAYLPAAVVASDRRFASEAALLDVAAELQRARLKFGPFHSAHEGYAVALEEVDELWEIVKIKQATRDLDKMRAEAIQAAAMFTAFAAECCGEKTGRV